MTATSNNLNVKPLTRGKPARPFPTMPDPLREHLLRACLTEVRGWPTDKNAPGRTSKWEPLPAGHTPAAIRANATRLVNELLLGDGFARELHARIDRLDAAGELLPGGPDGWRPILACNRRGDERMIDPSTGMSVTWTGSSRTPDRFLGLIRGIVAEHAMVAWLRTEIETPGLGRVEHRSVDDYGPDGGYRREWRLLPADVRIELVAGGRVDVEIKAHTRNGDMSCTRRDRTTGQDMLAIPEMNAELRRIPQRETREVVGATFVLVGCWLDGLKARPRFVVASDAIPATHNTAHAVPVCSALDAHVWVDALTGRRPAALAARPIPAPTLNVLHAA